MIKVLIVEDDPMVAKIDKTYIEQLQEFKVSKICNNGKEALEILNKEKIDLIILDVYMPKLNGIEVLREIRKNNIQTDVIMVTAAKETESLKEILSLGILDYLVKPFEYDRFINALKKFLKKYQLINENQTFSQRDIDSLINTKTNKTIIKKGLNEKTLEKIREYMRKNINTKSTSEEIAEHVGLSRVTVRRYMNYMVETNEITSEIDYSTGGRPSIKYKITCNSNSSI
ncbi:response regulator [Romboutsia sp. 1001713B170207_170306_H8]|uniref:response regulator n=1 Tax=Romboutsia sp. 1001713B170207_170306_H8 TaxID=2787112 RepID=UPI0008202ECA|nr:response regulator [Romboutsia sp. 1001713B170207_170306_H8]SCI04688.1 Transcriptional regulatory protein CitT [uncultured Clostridium sp.]